MAKAPLIADDYPAINRRMRELAGEHPVTEGFVLPPAMTILISYEVVPPVHLPPNTNAAFILHCGRAPRLAMIHCVSSTVMSLTGMLEHLRPFYPSVYATGNEIGISPEDCRRLVDRLHELRSRA